MDIAFVSVANFLCGLALAPLLNGVISRTKAFFAGRTGAPLFQPYFDLFRLLRKGVVYSKTASWVFRIAPVIGLAVFMTALALVPFGGAPALIAFPGDIFLFAYLLGLARFFTVIGALDTGSSFEGMGASREVLFSALAEPVFLLGLAAIARETEKLSLTGMFESLTIDAWLRSGPALALVAAALFFVYLTENCRIPVDDPNTHLELTMIHEVMALDYSGPDFAAVLYGASLKLWITGAVLIRIMLPLHSGNLWVDVAASVAGMFVLAALVGVVESIMARLKLLRIPQILLGAGTLTILALFLVLR